MAKIFDIQDWLKNNPNRNNFDLTHKVHGSYKFGYWYPFLCKPVVPTDSFHIETAVSTRFMPMPFPTQSNMRLIFHYHFVRAKNIWSNFENWIMGLEEHTPPYLNLPHTFFKDGSLADYLGVQTSYHSAARNVSMTQYNNFTYDGRTPTTQSHIPILNPFYLIKETMVPTHSTPFDYERVYYVDYQARYASFDSDIHPLIYTRVQGQVVMGDSFGFISILPIVGSNVYNTLYGENDEPVYVAFSTRSDGLNATLYPCSMQTIAGGVLKIIPRVTPHLPFKNSSVYIFIYLPVKSGRDVRDETTGDLITPYYFANVRLENVHFPAVSVEIGSNSPSACPYQCSDSVSGDTNLVKVSALPFRAYESVCRAYYRNTQGVQPFVVDGVTKYNTYNTTTADGADSTNYELFKRNWELDAYTSCLLSPQQTPVFVGLSSVSALGRMTIETPDGDEASVQLMDGENKGSVEYTNLKAETPEARRFALNAASLGFTIPEFREANSLQRWLELNLRKGYRYKDFIEGHFGKSPKYSELDMPEFLGGFTQKVSVNDISNTNGGTDASDIAGTLGAIAGQARAIGGSRHGVNHYFDDFGFVIGVFCIVPDVAYDCLLPKHFNLKSPLDFYFPEFSQTSFQEITYEELTPAQRKAAGGTLASSFGYQRPNHDLVWYPDTVHGRFRDAEGIGNSVICRRFSTAPQLSSEFLEIDPQSSDSIFSYTLGDEDICLGEIVIGITAKRPIPRLFNPSIS